MNTPERIFAVGGAGKAIAFELLESEWILREIIRPKPNPDSLTVTIIDTAQGEENEDRQRIRELREYLHELEEDLRDSGRGRTGDVEIEYKLITKEIQLNSYVDLLGDDVVPRIAAGNGMDEQNWWIDRQHINENLDFAKGVVRKRGLGKAIYYKAYAEDDTISSYIDLPDKGEVSVIGGLGGGTGSGILIDLARHLRSKQPTAEITLFGILPNKSEGIKENTNAFAALSELEYLALNDESVFKDRVLLPIDPTGFDGKTGNRIQTGELLNELDEAMVYLLASYYSTTSAGMEDPFAANPKFAPFTIGIPQVIRYNVEAISGARESIRAILTAQQDALDAEEQIYSEVDRFLSKHYSTDAEDRSLRDLGEADLSERLERIESLIELDLFDELEYESTGIFSTIIGDSKSEADSIVDQIEVLSGMLRAGTGTEGGRTVFVDDIDELLAETLEKSLELLVHRKELLQRKQAIDDSQVRDSVEYLLMSGDDGTNPGVRINRLEASLDDLRDRQRRLEEELSDTVDELEQRRQEAKEEIERQVDTWRRATEKSFDQFEAVSGVDQERLLGELETSLNGYATEIANTDSLDTLENVSEQNVRNALDQIESEFQSIGVEFQSERQDIERSLVALRNAKEAFIKLNQDEGTVEKLLPFEGSTEKERKEAQKDYRMQKTQLDDAGIFEISPAGTSFTVDVQYDTDRMNNTVERRRDELKRELIDQFRSRVSSEAAVSDFERALDGLTSLSNLEEIAREAFRDEAVDTSSIEERKTEIETELEEVRSSLELYEATVDAFEGLSSLRTTYLDSIENYQEGLAEYREQSDRSVSTTNDEYVYIKNVRPNDVFRATGNDNLAESDLLKSNDESQRLQGNLEELAENARNEQYTGLRRRKFSHDGVRYDDLKIRVSVLSQASAQIDEDTLDVEEMFKGAFVVGSGGVGVDKQFSAWSVEAGGPWEVGMSVFIDGVFIDNLRSAVGADGYHASYQQRHEELDDDILVHHSYGLEQGFYPRRKNMLNLEATEDVEFILQDEMDVVNGLIADYVERAEIPRAEPAGDGADD